MFTKEIALVVEKDDETFGRIQTALLQLDFQVERVKSYVEASKRVQETEFQRIVCPYNLTDKESFEFIGKVKQLPYNNPHLITLTSSFLSDHEKIRKFEDLLKSEPIRKELAKIFDSDFDQMNVDAEKESGPSYLEYSTKNSLPSDKTYIYDFVPEEILLGAWVPEPESKLDEKIILNVCLNGIISEVILTGSYRTVDPFDTNKGEVTYLSFQLDEKSKSTWKKYIDLFSAEDLKLEELLISGGF